ncbi:hypothetical protein [Caedibacter taeniospiralis]|uniref:hypothetical protein n=1 Tax=Caedibacter taeniospiralis TaxID=28907 RepID=UPI000C26DC49|nr:hypothetical protein [Caedibacter taeniospiralis]
MKAELLRSIVAAGEARKVGDVVELTKNEYDFLVSRGLVKTVVDKEVLEEKQPALRKANSKKTDN